MRSILFILLVFVASFASISFLKNNNFLNSEVDSYEEVMSVISDFSEKIEKKHGVRLTRYGLHYAGQDKVYDKKIHEIDLGYAIDESMKYKEARELFYTIVDSLIELINKHSEYKDFFSHFPIDYRDFHFTLSFDQGDSTMLKKDDISQISILGNEIWYHILQNDGEVDGIQFSETGPGLHTASFTLKTRTIRKPLPEID